MTKNDLRNHRSRFVEPIKINYKGFNDWQMPPNGQGIGTLIALNINQSKENLIRSLLYGDYKYNAYDLDKYVQDLHLKVKCILKIVI